MTFPKLSFLGREPGEDTTDCLLEQRLPLKDWWDRGAGAHLGGILHTPRFLGFFYRKIFVLCFPLSFIV